MSASTDTNVDRTEPGESAIAKLWKRRQQLVLEDDHLYAISKSLAGITRCLSANEEPGLVASADEACELSDEALWDCDNRISDEPFTCLNDVVIKAKVVQWRMINERPFVPYVAQLINDLRTFCGETAIENWPYLDFGEAGWIDGIALNYYDARKPVLHFRERYDASKIAPDIPEETEGQEAPAA